MNNFNLSLNLNNPRQKLEPMNREIGPGQPQQQPAQEMLLQGSDPQPLPEQVDPQTLERLQKEAVMQQLQHTAPQDLIQRGQRLEKLKQLPLCVLDVQILNSAYLDWQQAGNLLNHLPRVSQQVEQTQQKISQSIQQGLRELQKLTRESQHLQQIEQELRLVVHSSGKPSRDLT